MRLAMVCVVCYVARDIKDLKQYSKYSLKNVSKNGRTAGIASEGAYFEGIKCFYL